VKIPFYCWWCF